jgi:hypothetical protein
VRQGIVLLAVLFNAILGGIANQMKAEGKREDMKTLMLEDKIMTWRKDGKETGEIK